MKILVHSLGIILSLIILNTDILAQCSSSISPSGNATICAGTSLLASPTGSNYTYQWQDSTNAATGFVNIIGATNSNYTPGLGGYYRVVVTNTTTACAATSSITKVTLAAVPVASITATGPTTFCSGSSVSLLGSCTGCGISAVSYQWHLNGTPIATGGTSASYTVTNFPGTYSLCVVGSSGCVACTSVVVTINPIPLPPTVTSPIYYCQGTAPITLAATGTNLQWYSGSASLSSAPVLNSSSAVGTATYNVTQTLSGCTSSAASITANVVAAPAAPTVHANTPVCVGDTLFLAAAYTGAGPFAFVWTGPGGFSTSYQNPFRANTTVADSGVYRLRLITVPSGCLSPYDSVNVQLSCLDSVWPGDVNYDKIVDNLDALEIGLNLGSHGPGRTTVSTTWQAMHAREWPTTLTSFSTINGKHADCDGDSVVAYADTMAVHNNYGLTHPKGIHTKAAKVAGVPDLYFDFSGLALTPGTTVTVPVMLGNAAIPMEHIAGLAAKIIVGGLLPTDTPYLSFAGGWLGTPANTLRFVQGVNTNRVEWAFVRTDHYSSSGFGAIAYFNLAIPADAEGRTLSLSFEDVVLVDSIGNHITDFNALSDSTSIIPSAVRNLDQLSTPLSLFPNPSLGKCTAELQLSAATKYALQIYDFTGKLIWQEIVVGKSGKQQIILPSMLSPGTYLVSCNINGIPSAVPLKWAKLD